MDLSSLGIVAERKIQEAISEGIFDDLPGKGKPVDLGDSSQPQFERLANKVLKNAGVLPEWVQARKDLDVAREAVETIREQLAKESATRRERIQGAGPASAEWIKHADWYSRKRTAYHSKLREVNTVILKLCMLGPAAGQALKPFNVEAEMRSLDEACAAPSGAVTTAPEKAEGALKRAARERLGRPLS